MCIKNNVGDMMELKFQRNLDFQLDAIKSTVDIFESQNLFMSHLL